MDREFFSYTDYEYIDKVLPLYSTMENYYNLYNTFMYKNC